MEQKEATITPAGDRIQQVLTLLKGEYGAPQWQPSHEPMAVLVQTILSQNTSDANSWSAFRSLRAAFASWEELAAADDDAITRSIRSGGLGRIKAQRIKRALAEIIRQRGSLELDFLNQLSPEAAQDWLLGLPGVGLKTARCVLLFALGVPALPVDTHILRVSRRLELISPEASLLEAHRRLGAAVPPEDAYQFHVLMIEHGRKTCLARWPRCLQCTLLEICPWGVRHLQGE
ncbi:MAG: endonuclease III [Chloroflexota bacterium]